MYNRVMEKDPIKALEAGIYAWITDNDHLVCLAQEFSNLTVNLGLCDTNINNPFQIVPSDEFSTDGNLKHELFLNLDHPAWGYFKIIIKSESNFELIPPKLTLFDKTIFINKNEVIEFINYLSSTLDDLYSLQEHMENNELTAANSLLNKMLANYHSEIGDHLKFIKSYIDTFPSDIYLKATNSDDRQILDKNFRYDLALMHPENWFVKNYNGIFTQEAAQEELRCKILDFFITESQAASFLYVAQKLIIENNHRLIVHTDSKEPETDITNEVLFDSALNMTLVRPVIHAYKMEIISNG